METTKDNLKTTINSISSTISNSISSPNQTKFQTTVQQSVHSPPPPKLPPRNPISSTSSCSSSSNSPLTVHGPNKQLSNGKSISNKNELNATKSTIENKIAFNFMTKSSCTVNNSMINSNSNTCTIRQTTSTFNNCRPTTALMLNGSNSNSPTTGFSSSIVTTTTTQCLNNQRKINNNNELSKPMTDAYRTANSNNFVRGIFRSCNVNFGPNFKSPKFTTTSTTSSKAPANTLNSSLNATNTPGLAKLRTNEIDPLFNRESLSTKNTKLINKAIQQNGYLLKQVKTAQTTKNDVHKTNDVTTSSFNYLTNSVSSPSLNSSESDEDDEEEETELVRLNTGLKSTVKQTAKSSPNKLSSNHPLHNANHLKSSMQVYPPCPLQRSKTLMLNSNGKPELNRSPTRPQRIEITTTHHHPANCPKNRSLVSSPVSTVSTKSVWYEYGCV